MTRLIKDIKIRNLIASVAVAGLVGVGTVPQAAAFSYSISDANYNFHVVTMGSGTDISSSLFVYVTDLGDHHVGFTFKNDASGTGNDIHAIGFKWAGLGSLLAGYPLGIAGPDGRAPDFEAGGNQPNIPGYTFPLTFRFDGGQGKINPGDALQLAFNYSGAFSGITSAIENRTLDIGMHVGLARGSEKVIINTTRNGDSEENPVPDGGSTLALLGLALASVGALRRKLN